MRQLRLKLGVGLAMAGALVSCGGGGNVPPPLGDVVIHSDSVPQSFPTDAPVSVQMTQWQPINLTMTAGNALTMTVDATGSPILVYSWYFKGKPIDGQTGHTYTIPSVQLSDYGDYTVTVANSNSIAVSQALRLKVVPKVAPTNTGP